MDEISQNINAFESLLKNRSTNKPLALYAASEHKNNHVNTSNTSKVSAKEVLANVSRQIRAMQNADTVDCKRVGNTLDKYKKKEFLPVNRIPDKVPEKLLTKFETQCVSETQLLNVVENAEIIDRHRGVTQEFDKTFCQKSDNDSDNKIDDSSSKSNATDTEHRRIINTEDDSDVIKEDYNLNSQDTKMFENSELITCKMDTVTCCQNDEPIDDDIKVNSQETQGFNKCVEIFDVSDIERSTSPVLNTIKRSVTPALVVDLYTFEKFEDLAVPIIEEHGDLKVAKNMINSQIIGKEISIMDHFNEHVGRNSPVLNKIECIITNINKDEIERICSCSNKCMDKDVQNSNETVNEDAVLGSANKKTESKIKTEIKDEILFSSDEEYEYLHKNVQELPLTCALETSFYDKSDVLDKTMYVGFQTASNKSIQINTDSFTKAKSILSNIDNECTGKSLRDLVEIFDSGKAVSVNEEFVKKHSNKLENNISFKTSHKEPDKDKEFATPSTGTIDFKTKMNDTFKNVRLTALEEDQEVKEDIVMSQIIQFKSIPSSAKLHNSIIPDGEISHTVNLNTDPSKHVDDDFIMSQVLQCKSISRTPNVNNICTGNVYQESVDSNICLAKRKFKGFRTASNKKIKLSDKALTRCKNVFQDIDLGDSEDISCKSNIIDTEGDFLGDFNSHDFVVSDDDLKTKSDLDLTSAPNLHENVSDTANLRITLEQNYCETQTNLKVKEEKPSASAVRFEDAQINDKDLLQEFEDNEMPFEENNTKAYGGSITASDENIDVSENAKAGTKNVFQDIITFATENDSGNARNPAENLTGDGTEHLFKKPAADFKKWTTRQTKSSIGTLDERCKNNECQKYGIQIPVPGDLVGFRTASNKEIIISEQAKEKSKGFYKDLDDEFQSIDDKVKVDSKNESNDSTKLEDNFNCGIDTQDFLAEELTHFEDLFKDNILENRQPIFQGFQTANHKPIGISKKALEKSKKLLEDITNKDIEMKYHSIDNAVNCGKEEIKNSEDTNIVNTNKERDKINSLRNETSILAGFHSASNNKVVVSNKAIEASKKVFQDIVSSEENSEQNKKTDVCGFTLATNSIDLSHTKTVENGSKAISKSGPFLNIGKTITNCSNDILTAPPMFVGFKTASSKPIHITAIAMEKTKKLLSEFELNGDEIMFENVEKSPLDSKPSASDSFQTASNENVPTSAKTLTESKQMLNDFEFKDYFYNVNDDHKNEKIINKACDLIESNIHQENLRTVNTSKDASSKFIGFKTASNKEVKISKEALARSKTIFQDEDLRDKECNYVEICSQHGVKANTVHQDFQTKKAITSETAIKESEGLFHDRYIKCSTNTNINAPVFKGFQTASNKKVQISETALAKSKTLFQDMNLSQLDKDSKTVEIQENNWVGLQTANNKKIEVSDQVLTETKDTFRDIFLEKENDSHTKDSTPVFKGFHTARNRKVQISDVALVKSKRLFEDMNLSQVDEDAHENNLLGFQKARNKIVKVSEQSLEKTKNVLRDIALEYRNNTHSNDTPAFQGFQTASNKKVEISEKALAKSKRLFEGINLSQMAKDPQTAAHEDNLGNQKANKQEVVVSAEAKQKNSNIYENIEKGNDYVLSENKNASVFKGFQTASNKKVVISDNALAKCKKLFEDMNLSQIDKDPMTAPNSYELQSTKENYFTKNIIEPLNNVLNVQSASNRGVKVSEQTLLKSKNIVTDKYTQNKNNTLNKDKNIKTPENNITANKNNVINNDIIDTQVLNDFQETLNTEDFCKSTPTSKRSGSPILSCPRAKKRRFETPYRVSKKIEPKTAFVAPKLAKTYEFDNNYKKNKEYTLKDVANIEKGHIKNIDPYITEFNFDNLLHFIFKDERNDYTTQKMTTEDIKKIFLGSINKKIVPDGWLDNHIKLIIWKLLSYEIKFPNAMRNTCTVKNVLDQLKYRYDRELYHVQRPILRKILEKDEVASKTMVLCVAGIYVDNVSVTSVAPTSQNIELLLTDGWYCVKACLDRMLVRLTVSGAVRVGTKIAVCGAELINCEQGVAPWEDTSSVRLKLHGNGVRRARWDSRLGLRNDLIHCPLGAAKSDGGKMSATRVLVTRVYPPLYVEKMDDGSTVTLSERLEQIRQMRYESERQAVMEKLYEEVEKEMSDQDSQDSEGCSNEKLCMDSGSQISKNMKKSKDPEEYRSHLTTSQNRLLEDHSARQREKLIERVRTKFQQKLEKNGLTDRNVVPLLKVRVAGLIERDGRVDITKGYLSIWKPSAAVLELVTEGAWVEILNVIPTGIRNSEIQLSAGRQTVFNHYKQSKEKFQMYKNILERKCYKIKEISQNLSMATENNEIDTVGMIFCVDPSTKDFKEQSFQNIYLADADKNMICVNFWGGLKKFGFENVLDTGQIVTCVNLQKRAGNTRKSIPQYRATEFSYFTKTPKNKKALEITNELSNKLSKIKDKFCEDCLVLKNNYSVFKTRDNEHVSPYRFEYNIPKNMISPLLNCDTNLNLTGLDFESSFNSQEISPQLLLRKKKVNEKIEKLRINYGEPPPLSSIHIINKSKNASATYKSPLISNLERSKMAESPGLQNVASPVTVNRTFVKNVNPVKLNFSCENLDESVDHFAEDFDASPPLSLDSDILN